MNTVRSDVYSRVTDQIIIRELIQTTPLVFDVDGLPVGYEASQFFGLKAAYLGGRV